MAVLKKYIFTYKYQRKSDKTRGHEARWSTTAYSEAEARAKLFKQTRSYLKDRIPYAIKLISSRPY